MAMKPQIQFSMMALWCGASALLGVPEALLLSFVTSCLAGWYKNLNPNIKFLLFLAYSLKIFFSVEAEIFSEFSGNFFFFFATSNLTWDKNLWSYRNKETIFRKNTLARGFTKTSKKDTARVQNMAGVPPPFPSAGAAHWPRGLIWLRRQELMSSLTLVSPWRAGAQSHTMTYRRWKTGPIVCVHEWLCTVLC